MGCLVVRCWLAVAAIMMMVVAPSAMAQITTPCNASVLTAFTPCMNFLTNSTSGSTSSPTTQCCDSLKSLTASGMDCLCLIVTGSVPFSIPFNRTLAISLPRACRMPGVPVQCKSTGSPLPAPGPASLGPSPSPSSVPSGFTPTPSPQGSSIVPSANTPSSLSPSSSSVDSSGSPSSFSSSGGRNSDLSPSSSSLSSQIPSSSSLILLLIALPLALLNHH